MLSEAEHAVLSKLDRFKRAAGIFCQQFGPVQRRGGSTGPVPARRKTHHILNPDLIRVVGGVVIPLRLDISAARGDDADALDALRWHRMQRQAGHARCILDRS